MKAAKRAKKSGAAADFHRLRIRCKRLRYSLEFSAELYAGRTSRYTKRLAALQDQLGLMQDSEVAAARLAAMAITEAHLSPETIFVMGGVAQHHRREMDRLLRLLPEEVARAGGKAWAELLSLMERNRAEAESAHQPVHRVLRTVPAPVPDVVETVAVVEAVETPDQPIALTPWAPA
jgi:CHAD domain-containing protein